MDGPSAHTRQHERFACFSARALRAQLETGSLSDSSLPAAGGVCQLVSLLGLAHSKLRSCAFSVCRLASVHWCLGRGRECSCVLSAWTTTDLAVDGISAAFAGNGIRRRHCDTAELRYRIRAGVCSDAHSLER